MLVKRIKSIIPETAKIRIKLLLETSRNQKWTKYEQIKGERIFVFLAGFYQNLGDMAITYAQVLFLESINPSATIICVPSTETYSSIKTLKRIIKDEDIITITGGGNMDDNYLSLELARLHIVKSFPNNKIVSFPQTVNYSQTRLGKRLCGREKRVYEKHKDLHFFVREQRSLGRIRDVFPGLRVQLCPDIVLSLDNRLPNRTRNGVVCCLRKDKEQLLNDKDRGLFIESIQLKYDRVMVVDTTDVSKEQCSENHYKTTLNEFWELIKRSQAVVTDRLHGMLFCVITGTPCVVLDNKNHKISEFYDTWLNKDPSIVLIRTFDQELVINAVNKIMNRTEHKTFKLDFNFEKLKQVCTVKKESQ